ncbi:MAG: hypothetical protein KGI58_03865 [Patescibacteria group bacterium]|nr:hypothetical protein [Patescibacteria group bacterium]
MKLKCIGGECDGKIMNVDYWYRTGDHVRVQKVPDYVITDYVEDLKSMTVEFYLYKIACLHFSKDDKMQFLIPHDWSDKQAILYQFGK